MFSLKMLEQSFSDSTLDNLLRKSFKEMKKKFVLSDSVSDSLKFYLQPFNVNVSIIPKKEIIAFNSMKVESIFLCVNKKNKVGAYIFFFSNHSENLFDSLISRIDSPKISSYLNIDEVFNTPCKSISYYWSFNNYAINFKPFCIENKDVLVISTKDVKEYMKTY